jgi:hypothetical protein
VLYQYADFCPYCGTDRPLDTVVLGTRLKPAISALGDTSALPPVPAAAKLSATGIAVRPSVKPAYQHQTTLAHASPFWQMGRWTFSKVTFLVCFGLAIAYAAFLLLGANRKPESATDGERSHSSAGLVAAWSPQQSSNTTSLTNSAGPQAVSPKSRAVPHFKDVPDSLRAARASLAENNLADAKAANHAALARDPDNEDALAIQREIAAREQRRDSALQSADQCVRQSAWACAQQHASEALALDSGSVQAQSLMERAIVSTAWPPLSAPKPPNSAPQAVAAVPLPRGAGAARLPSSKDWDTAAEPAAPKVSTTPAPPPPLPSATKGTNTANAAKAANVPASENSADPDSAKASAMASAATQPATADAAPPASQDNSVDAQERAILQSGWKHATPPGASQ